MATVTEVIDRTAVADELKRLLAFPKGNILTVADSSGTRVEVDISSIRKDFLLFNEQARFLQGVNEEWPSVRVKWVNEERKLVERLVPINLFPSGMAAAGAAMPNPYAIPLFRAVVQAVDPALPLEKAPILEVRKNFISGAADFVTSRALRTFFNLGGAASHPEVEARTSPAGQRVMYTDGHFFSVATVFGKSIISRRIPAGIYSFWISGTAPTTALELWTINTDTVVDV